MVTPIDSTQLLEAVEIDQPIQGKETPNKVDYEKSKLKIINNEEKIESEENEVIAFPEPKAITLEQAYKLYNKGILFIDARDESDFLAGHISNSMNIPFDDFDNHKQKLKQISKDKPIVIYCAGTDCDLSILLGNLLFEQGYKQVYVFFGGWIEWLDADYPVKHPSESN